jgi:hypothetical protein
MTIMATHFAIVLGAWRLRVRIDVDEPRESELSDERLTPREQPSHTPTNGHIPHPIGTWGRG